MEGATASADRLRPDRADVTPVAEYGHDLGCSVTGGYVYRGSAQPRLQGVYVFGDYCSGIVFTLQVDEGTIDPKRVLDSGLGISVLRDR